MKTYKATVDESGDIGISLVRLKGYTHFINKDGSKWRLPRKEKKKAKKEILERTYKYFTT